MNRFLPASLCLAALLSLAASGPAPAQPADRPALSLEDTVSLRRVTKAVMSPSGDAIAYLLSVPRTVYEDDDGPAWTELHVVRTDGASRPYAAGQVDIDDVAWSPDGATLYFSGKRDLDADNPTIYRMALDGGDARAVYHAETGISSIHVAPDGETLAFLAKEPEPKENKTLAEKGFKAKVYEESARPVHVWMLDLASGEATKTDLGGSVSGFDWAPGGERYAVAMAPTPLIDDEYMARDIFVVSAEDAAIEARMGTVGKLGEFAFAPDGRHIAWIGAEDIHDPSEGRLYAASARGGEPRELVPEYAGQVEDFRWLSDETVAWVGSRGLWTEAGRTSLDRPRKAGRAPESGPIVRSLHAVPGQRDAAVVADTPAHPPEVYLMDADGELRRLTDSNPWLAERRLARQGPVTYRARDGLELEAVVVYPEGDIPDGGAPMVMVIHGGPEAHYSNGWNDRYASPAHTLAAEGYLVVLPNYRGSTGRGVAFSKMGQHDYAGAEFDDIVDAKRHFVQAGLADGDRTGITGGSYGGFASMWAASALSEHFAAAVAFVGISDQISKFGTTDIPQEMYNVHARAWPWDDWLWKLERSPIYHAGKVKTPLLIMHGEEDTRVHPSQSLEMYRHVKVRTDTPVRLVYYPGEGHGNRRTAAQYDYALRLKRWMDHYLKGPGGEPPPWEIDHAARLAEATEEAKEGAKEE